MSQVFVSYAREDAAAAKMLADALKNQGFSVWWDRYIQLGKPWDEVIGSELEKASCVIVLWSRISVQSRWVREEAERAAARNCLVPVFVEKVDPPLGFGRIEAADLSRWRGDVRNTAFSDVLTAVTDLVNAPPDNPTDKPTNKPTVHPLKPSPGASIVRNISIWTAAAVVVIGVAFYAARGDSRKPDPAVTPPGESQPQDEQANHAKAYAARGMASYNEKRYPEAIKDLDEALRLDPSNAEWYNERGRAYSMSGLQEPAIQDYTRAIERKQDAMYYSNRGYARTELGHPEEALADLNQAVLMVPKSQVPRWFRGSAYLKLKDWPAAITDFSVAIEQAPNDPDYFNARGYAYSESGNPAEALADLDKAIQLNPGYQAAFENRAMVYAKLKDWPRAIADWSSAMKVKETRWQYEGRAEARRASGDEAGAAADQLRAGQLTSSWP